MPAKAAPKGKKAKPLNSANPSTQHTPMDSALSTARRDNDVGGGGGGGDSPTASDISHFRPNWNEGGHEVPLPASERTSGVHPTGVVPPMHLPGERSTTQVFDEESRAPSSVAPSAANSHLPLASSASPVRGGANAQYDEGHVAEQQELHRQMAATAQLLADRLNSVSGKKVSAFDAVVAVGGGSSQETAPSPNPYSHTMAGNGTVMPNGLHPSMYEATSESPTQNLKRIQSQKKHVAPKLLEKLPDNTLATISTHNVGLKQLSPIRSVPPSYLLPNDDDDRQSVTSSTMQGLSPTHRKFNLPRSGMQPDDTLATTMQSITTTRGPMLRPAERASRDAKWAVSTATNFGEEIPNALRKKEVELANALSEWRAVEKEFSMHQRLANEMLNSKRELDAINTNHKLDMTRMRQEIKTVQTRVNAQDQDILRCHDKIREASLKMQLATNKRTKQEVVMLKDLERLNGEIEALDYVKAKDEKDYNMEMESHVKRADKLAKTIDSFEAESYVQTMLEDQAERMRLEKVSDRAKQQQQQSKARVSIAGDDTNMVVVAKEGDEQRQSEAKIHEPVSDDLASTAPAPSMSPSAVSSTPSKVDRSAATVKKNRGNLEKFLGGGHSKQ